MSVPSHDSFKKAEDELNHLRAEAINRIEACGDKLINDTSFIRYNGCVVGGEMSWTPVLNLWTKSLYNDLLEMERDVRVN